MATDTAQSKKHQRALRGFTFIELLVVLAFIGILMSILLPWVQQAREAARRTQCKQNLAQIGLALQHYEIAHGWLPPGSVDPSRPILNVPRGYHVGWIVQLLPFMEEGNTWRNWDFQAGVYDPANRVTGEQRIRILRCPSFVEFDDSRVSTTYAGMHHDSETPIDSDNNGVLFLNSRIGFRDIIDGESHTIFVAETTGPRPARTWASGTNATLRNAGCPINVDLVVSPGIDPRTQSEDDKDLFVGGFGSIHQGGMHVLMGDGRVTFPDEHIDYEVYRRLANRRDEAEAGEY